MRNHTAWRENAEDLVPTPRPPANPDLRPRWYSTSQVADMLGFGLYKTKMLIASGELRSLKDGKYRRILPEWVDDYVNRRAHESFDDRPPTIRP